MISVELSEISDKIDVGPLKALKKLNAFSEQCLAINQVYHEYRCSRPEVLCKKDALRNFAKFTGKHLCRSLFFNKVAATLLKKRLWHRCFPVSFAKFLITPFVTEHLRATASLSIGELILRGARLSSIVYKSFDTFGKSTTVKAQSLSILFTTFSDFFY